MAIQQQWEYESPVRQGPMEAPCGCGCHTVFQPVHPIYATPHRPVEGLLGSSHPGTNRSRRGFADSLAVRCGKSIVATVLAMLIVADIGVNAAHNAGAVVSRIVPVMEDRPFYFDPLALVHDVDKVIH
jgi:hypothetical protein